MRKRALATLALGTLLASRALAGEPPRPPARTNAPAASAPATGAHTTGKEATGTETTGAQAAAGGTASPPAAASPGQTGTHEGDPTTRDSAPPAARPAPPRSGSQAIAEARRAVEDQRYEDALSTLAPHLASSSRATRASALEITAIVRLLLGRQAEGREAVAALYELAPGFLLDDPSLPPRVTRVFEAEAALPHGRSVTMAIRPASGERGLFEVSVTQPTGALDLACSPAKPPSFAPVEATKTTDGFRFRLPTLAAHRCYATARDADGLPLGRLGSAARPVDVAPPPPAPPLVTRWWVWTAVGVAAAAIAAGAIVATQQPHAPPAADITVRPQHVVLSW